MLVTEENDELRVLKGCGIESLLVADAQSLKKVVSATVPSHGTSREPACG